MSASGTPQHLAAYFFVVSSALLDIGANMLMKMSNGFKRIGFGAGAIGLVCAAYALLVRALQTLDLSIAYATWGGLGIMGTALAGQFFFNEGLNRLGWAGIIVVVIAVIVLNTA